MKFTPEEEKSEQNEYYENYPVLSNAWIYVAIDIRHMNMSKVGLTTAEHPKKRLSQGTTYNPFLKLFSTYELSKCTYGMSQKELSDMEKYIHRRAVFGEPFNHLQSKRKTEWFLMEPESAETQIDWFLAKRGFSVDGYYLFTYFEGVETYNEVVIERMKKIKKIYRQHPKDFLSEIEQCNIPLDLVQDYYNYLNTFHKEDRADKAYI